MSKLVFEPLDATEPDGGTVIEFRKANPDYADELAKYREQLERNPFAADDLVETLTMNLTDPAEALLDADELCTKASRLTFVVGYPFAGQYAVRVDSPGGFTRGDLFRHIVAIHVQMFEAASQADLPHLYNKKIESPRFGIAYHRMEDLYFESLVIDGDRAWVYLGS